MTDNPDCTREARCGQCLKDRRANSMRERWADGTFVRANAARASAWSRDEVEFVARRAGMMSVAQIVRELNDAFDHHKRTAVAVRWRCQHYGIPLRPRGYSTGSLGRALGIDLTTIKRYIATGYLVAERRGPRWIILPASAERFLRKYPWMYDLGGIDPRHPLFLVARSAHRGEQWLGSAEVAFRVGARSRTVRELAQRGVLPSERRWHQWVFRASQLPEIRETLRRLHKRSKEEGVAA